ncbi:zeta-sarcoglycan-like protein [Dermatophagoides farinae]|uniref:Zeta-sarcoglycan-like protein n=1 Tax=Dermatophagoides farinae TaxID=6954 RepID=A0A9D4SLZ0_DERFA|nr:zeta-sarcoglycan-like protein [Dermatophagoides farinae]
MIIGNRRHSHSRSHSHSRPSSLMFQNYHPLIIMNDNNRQSINPGRRRFTNVLETQLDQDTENDFDYNGHNVENYDHHHQHDEQQQQYYAESGSECPPITEHPVVVDQQMMLMYPSVDDYHAEYLMQQEVGIYGWRKKILYILLVINIVMVGINFALAFWIVSVLGFSTNGIGPVDFGSLDNNQPDNDQIIRIHGSAVFEKLLFARHLKSWPNDEFRMTTKNGDIIFRSLSNDSSQINGTRLIISNDKIQLFTNHFEVYDRKNSLMFALDSSSDESSNLSRPSRSLINNQSETSLQQITIRTNAIKFLNDINNLNLQLSLQTPSVINTINDELRLYSPQSRLLLRGPKSIHLESKLGDISLVTYDNLQLQSNVGRITLDSRAIYLRKLWTTSPTTLDDNKTLNTTENNLFDESLLFPKPIVYQVCVCSKSGRLFLTQADKPCQVKSYRDCR